MPLNVRLGSRADIAGGSRSIPAWGLAFLTLGAGVALGPVAIALLLRRRARP